MILIGFLVGFVVLALGFVLYRMRQRKKPAPSRGFRCVHRVTESGEPISYILAPRDTTEP